jgi:polyisoprenoid-binding protein YceI
MSSRRLSWVLFASLCAVPALLFAATAASQAKVSFVCVGPGGLHFEATGSELSAQTKGDALVLTVPLANITTGIGIRDTHMKEKYLETAKYPTAELSVPRAALKLPADGASVNTTAPGMMTIHGVSKPVTFHYKASRKGASYDVQGDVTINMNDYGIPTPTYLGVAVKPPVDIAVSFRVVEP